MSSLTEIVFILDRSGSMNAIKSDAIGGFNSFIEEQKKVEGKANVTLITFNESVQTVYVSNDISDVEDLDNNKYNPIGLTAMLDAIGVGIDGLNKRLSEQEVQPNNIIFAIMTDGFENASREYSSQAIKTKIENMQKEKDWQFLFLGANINAVDTAESIGIKGMYAGQFSADGLGTRNAILNASAMTTSYRATGQMASYADVANKTSESANEIADALKNVNKKVEKK